jgi:hypothetical protein
LALIVALARYLMLRLTAKNVQVNTRYAMHFLCRLPSGRCRFAVYTTDAAGNSQAKAKGNWLLVGRSP